MEDFKHIVVIGASAGGISAVIKLLDHFDNLSESDAAFFIVIHLSVKSNAENILQILQKHTSLKCTVPIEVTTIQKGNLYLAPANRHMLIKNGIVFSNAGPPENKYRPAIDVLFRTAAVYYGPRVIGIILTGALEDGTSGMSAIKRCGGTCIIQDPYEAEFPDMPQSVLNLVPVDYKVPLNDMAYILKDVISRPIAPDVPIPDELKVETEITENMMTSIDELNSIANQSEFTCPTCGGGLWEIRNDPAHRYRCYTGHVFSEKTLSDVKDTNLEESVYVCIRMLEEKRNIYNLMLSREENAGNKDLATKNKSKVEDTEKHIARMKQILNMLIDGRNESSNET